ncbi:MAG TPA: 50S ribosomal protein L10 [Firmicutes bacterium]|nr:50S ribosomal protein L10 [Candidatus Fermentithermobacillaceae bacterium]
MGTRQKRQKARVQETLKEQMSTAKSVIFADFRGVSVADDTRLRQQCRENDVLYRVIKNSLALRAARDLNWDGLDDIFKGPTAMAVSNTDPVAPARVLRSFSLETPVFKIKGGVLDGQKMTSEKITFLATLPSRETLLTQTAVAMKGPISALATVLNGTLVGFARVLDGLKTKKEKGEI